MGKWAGYCAKCAKWRTWEMAGKPSGEQAYWVHHRLRFMKSEQPELEEVKSWVICKKLERVGTQWIGGIGCRGDDVGRLNCIAHFLFVRKERGGNVRQRLRFGVRTLCARIQQLIFQPFRTLE